MATVDHDICRQSLLFQLVFTTRYTFGVVVWLSTAPEYNVRVTVSSCVIDRALSFDGNAQEVLLVSNGLHGVDRHIYAPVSAVLDTDGSGKATRHLPVSL